MNNKAVIPSFGLSHELDLKFKVVRMSGLVLDHSAVLLDFGCGSGKWVQEMRNTGFQAFGCGTRYDNEPGVNTEEMIARGLIRILDLKNYALPFDDNTFDFIFSDNVFEHVQNYDQTNAEIARVIKENGLCLHIFPSRWRPVESHVYVPFASVFQSYAWQYLWSVLGVHNEWENCSKPEERARRFQHYLQLETNYLSKKDLMIEFKKYFNLVDFVEDKFLMYSRRGRLIHKLSAILPVIPSIYSTFRSRVILLGLPKKMVAGLA